MGTIQEIPYNGCSDTGSKEIRRKNKTATNSHLDTITQSNLQKSSSMCNLIEWNISKALEKNPHMDLKCCIRAAQDRLERDARDGNAVISQYPEEQHLVCALLAWHQLGHTGADSLYQFIEKNRDENQNSQPKTLIVTSNSINIHCNNDPNSSKDVDTFSFGSYSNGPVVKLPVETKIIMRVENTPSNPTSTRSKRMDTDTTSKINAACCMESACAEQLAAMDAATSELRSRASKLARREAERVELLERAEAAWRDLELGYQRRLTLAEEKEEDMSRQIQKVIQERNGHKTSCDTLTKTLKEKNDEAEKLRTKLKAVEKDVCDRACQRQRLSEEAARGESALADQHCKLVQLERDLQFKEEQARRKLLTMDSETESARALTHEAERALRAELSGLREQIDQVSTQLLEEDEMNRQIKDELEKLREDKMAMVEDLDGCKALCDSKMQAQLDDLQKKREQLKHLKEQVMDCQCQLPVDATVEAKRTPSLAALCRCAPEDRLLESCSCTSLKTSLLSNLLADLFGGLQSELGGTGMQMPCQLLKCLEDKHNWDRASIVKSNLRNFFSKLLVGELDIAIATSIENYHAKWVGASCADAGKMTPGPKDDLKEGWEQRALERRAQSLAAKLAEQLFEERADQLTKRAKEIVTSGPPPCECHKKGSQHAAVFPCLMETLTPFGSSYIPQSEQLQATEAPAYWKRTLRDVTQLKRQVEDLKNETIKKQDLKLMEDKITKIVKQAAGPDSEDLVTKDNQIKFNRNELRNMKNTNMELTKNVTFSKPGLVKKKVLDATNNIKKSIHEKPTKQPKKYSYHQSYAVNLCLCGPQKVNKVLQGAQAITDQVKSSFRHKSSKEILSQPFNVKQSKPININIPPSDTDDINSKFSIEPFCDSNCKCLNKEPSNTSIDKLLDTLTKWKYDLGEPQNKSTKSSKSILKNKDPNDSKLTYKQKVSEGGSDKIIQKKVTGLHKNNQLTNTTQVVNSASEYIAAVNLEKSNDFSNKSIETEQGNKEDIQLKNNTLISNGHSNKCLNSTSTESKKSLIHKEIQKTESKNFSNINVLSDHLCTKIKNLTELNILTNSKSTRIIPSEQNLLKSEINEEIRSDLISKEVNQANTYPNNFDYYIKFLGVTLADTDSQKVSKSFLKAEDIKTDNYPSSYKEYKVEIETTAKPLNEPIKQLVQDNYLNIPETNNVCQCSEHFEEFKDFIINILSDQLKEKTLHQNYIDHKVAENAYENCICCDNNFHIDNTKDLEVNAFQLLEEHLKEKFKKFQICSCKSSCIPPEEVRKIFSSILERVKQVISDCTNEVKRNESKGLSTDGSWNRAYGLLQEYLKIKIKRAQSAPPLNEDKDTVLPKILEKVCNLIESDFQRLKDVYTCEKNNKNVSKHSLVRKIMPTTAELPETDISNKRIGDSDIKMLSSQNSAKHSIPMKHIANQVHPEEGMKTKSCNAMIKVNGDVVKISSEQNSIENTHKFYTLPVTNSVGIDTKSCDAMYEPINIVKSMSMQNSVNPIVTQNISSQVPPELGMETKSCDIMKMVKSGNKSEQTTKTKSFILKNGAKDVIYNNCDCFQNSSKKSLLKFFGNKEILVNLYADILMNSNEIGISKSNRQTVLKYLSVNNLRGAKSLPNFDTIGNNIANINVTKKTIFNNESSVKLPYIGCTLDCICDHNLKSCICTKSAIKASHYKVCKDWQQFISGKNYVQDLSYIMKGKQKKNIIDLIKPLDKTVSFGKQQKITVQQNKSKIECGAETNLQNEEDIVLLVSKQKVNTIHDTTCTSFDENTSMNTELGSESPIDWFERPIFVNSEPKPSTVKLTNSTYLYQPEQKSQKYYESETSMDTETCKSSPRCNCDRVPICHVKMLVENIERNLLESKCTCDSIYTICPVHSRASH